MDISLPINSINGLRSEGTSSVSENLDQMFYGHGKLLLSGEYLILNGAKGLALPTKLGQSLSVKYSQSFSPTLYWKSYDYEGDLWLETKFEFWHFDVVDGKETPQILILQKLLRQARKQNFHFLRESVDVHVESYLEFPLDWGLGSSSTLIYNIAQWAYISPFELLFNAIGEGSGYDIACAQSQGPILYTNKTNPKWETVTFDPCFKDNLYFLYLGNKQNTSNEIQKFNKNNNISKELIEKVSALTDRMVEADSIEKFELLICEHEEILSEVLNKKRIKEDKFPDYWGEVKSLGAWGGDFALVTSNKSFEETKEYFLSKDLHVLMPYSVLAITSRFDNNRNVKINESLLH